MSYLWGTQQTWASWETKNQDIFQGGAWTTKPDRERSLEWGCPSRMDRERGGSGGEKVGWTTAPILSVEWGRGERGVFSEPSSDRTWSFEQASWVRSRKSSNRRLPNDQNWLTWDWAPWTAESHAGEKRGFLLHGASEGRQGERLQALKSDSLITCTKLDWLLTLQKSKPAAGMTQSPPEVPETKQKCCFQWATEMESAPALWLCGIPGDPPQPLWF